MKEAWNEYQDKRVSTINCNRDPNNSDGHFHSIGCEWNNDRNGKKFILRSIWEEIC